MAHPNIDYGYGKPGKKPSRGQLWGSISDRSEYGYPVRHTHESYAQASREEEVRRLNKEVERLRTRAYIWALIACAAIGNIVARYLIGS